MKTFGMGDVVLHDVQSISEATAICRYLDEYRRRRDSGEFLRKVSHGHVFGYSRTCDCGVEQIEYLSRSCTSDNTPCRASQAKLLDRETAGAEYARLDKLFKESR